VIQIILLLTIFIQLHKKID